MNKFLESKGFTLIEVITSMAIVSILLITIISFLGQSFTQIFSLGNRTSNLYTIQGEIEGKLGDSYGNENNNNKSTLSFKVGDKSITVEGLLYNESIDENSKVIKAFVPKKLVK